MVGQSDLKGCFAGFFKISDGYHRRLWREKCKHPRHQFPGLKRTSHNRRSCKSRKLSRKSKRFIEPYFFLLLIWTSNGYGDFSSCCIVQISDQLRWLARRPYMYCRRCASSSPTERNAKMCMFAFRDFFSPSVFCSPVLNVCVPHFIALSISKHS